MIRSNLAVLLAERKLKISKVSMETGISRTTLTALCNNTSQGVQLETVDTLCTYLKVTPTQLISHIPFFMHIVSIEVNDKRENEFCDKELTLSIFSGDYKRHKRYTLFAEVFYKWFEGKIVDLIVLLSLPPECDPMEAKNEKELNKINLNVSELKQVFSSMTTAFLDDFEIELTRRFQAVFLQEDSTCIFHDDITTDYKWPPALLTKTDTLADIIPF